MKTSTLLFTISAVAVLSLPSRAQESATATVTATIVAPIAISKDIDMNFGNVAVQSSTGGTVVMTPAGVRSTTGGVTLPTTTGNVAAASFTVSGVDGYTYSITLPTAAVTITNTGGNTMTVTAFTSSPSGQGTLTGGSETLTVGATLNVTAAQAPGTYVSATPFAVTVNYD
ncbi:DUF4402 domain-containing protein [Chitinophaga caseinilytica]|uniref:DUF4402 domain-containing protein n=1 Tax=Chitinophaga caseinilytica TaxID=2267521 RepID=A0ABZ2Z6N8_9BACT